MPEYEEISVGNTKGLRILDPATIGGCGDEIIIIEKSRLYKLQRSSPSCNYPNETFNQILSTFKFID